MSLPPLIQALCAVLHLALLPVIDYYYMMSPYCGDPEYGFMRQQNMSRGIISRKPCPIKQGILSTPGSGVPSVIFS